MPIISLSTSCFGDRERAAALDAIAEAGFDGVELSVAHVDEVPAPGEATEIRRQIEARGLVATTVHGPARRNVLGAPTESWRKEKVVILGSYLHFTGELGAQGMVIHGIPNPMFLPQDRPLTSLYGVMVESMAQSVEELVPVAAEAGVRVLLENLPYNHEVRATTGGDYPLMSMRQLSTFVEPFPPEQVALIIDTGHAATDRHDPVDEIEAAGDRLWGTHLQDVDAEEPDDNHWVPTHGGLDWPAICAALKRIEYPGAWTFEVINGRKGESPDELARLTRAVASSWD